MSDLPAGWTETTLGEIASQGQYGWTSKASEKGQVKYLRTTDITPGHINWDTVPYCQDNPPNVKKYKIELGDILISRAGSVGFSALIHDLPSTPVVFASYLIRYIPDSEVHSKFVARFLQSPNYWQQISDASAGIALANVNAKKLANVVLPLPPLNEQKRITDKLDSLLTRVDSCQTHLERVPQILKRFRQSVLAAATSGRLTEDWREKHAVNGEWETVQLSEVATSRLGKMLDVAKNRGELHPYLRNINVRWFAFDLSDIQELRISEEEAKTLGVRKGDVLVCEGGEPGRCAVWYGEDDIYLFQKALHRVRVGEKLLPEWLCYCLKSSADSGKLAEYFTGTTIKHFTGVSLSRFEFDLPSLEEQAEIVQRVEKLFAYADRLEAHYTSASEHVERLTPSLLAKAFRGELVEQDPNDEAAEKLLERIAEEKKLSVEKPKRIVKRKEPRMYKMKETLEDIIRDLPKDTFSFEDLQEKYSGDYEKLKDELFMLLNAKEPLISQVFDKSSQSMRFVRRK